MNKEEFINALKDLNIQISDKQLNQLESYYYLLIKWNKVMNLTAITIKEDVYLKHFYDSLTISKVIDLSREKSLCDIGTGAGFPGMVLKIIYPKLQVTLVDSLQKRIKFLEEVKKKLELKDLNIVHARAEEFAKEHREQFDIVTARAVAPINILLEYCIPMIKVNKYFIALKGNSFEEINSFNESSKKINCKLLCLQEFTLPKENSNRTIFLITKENKTKTTFPRRYNEIKNKPL